MKALTKMDGQKIGIKYCSVRFAKIVNYDEFGDRAKPRIEIPALGGTKESGPGTSRSTTGDKKKDSAIQAIEAKLRMLESKTPGDEFKVNRTASQSHEAPISKYQFNLNNDSHGGKYSQNKRHQRHQKPYNSRPRR